MRALKSFMSTVVFGGLLRRGVGGSEKEWEGGERDETVAKAIKLVCSFCVYDRVGVCVCVRALSASLFSLFSAFRSGSFCSFDARSLLLDEEIKARVVQYTYPHLGRLSLKVWVGGSEFLSEKYW